MTNKSINIGLIMAALFWLGLASAAPLAAQPNEAGTPAAGPETGEASPGFLRAAPAEVDAAGNRLPADWPGLTVKKLERRLTSPQCPDNYQDFVFHYPQGFGNVVLDGAIASAAADRFNREVEERRQGGFCDKAACGSASCAQWGLTRTFEVYRPSPNFVSILYVDYSYTGGAHDNTVYEGATYNLLTGLPMNILELFAQPREAVPEYWQMVYRQWCENAEYKFPLHYRQMEPCGQADGQGNPNTFTWASDLSDLGRLIFSPQGASLVLGPYESGSFASGTVVMDFKKEDLMAIGASPSVWGR